MIIPIKIIKHFFVEITYTEIAVLFNVIKLTLWGAINVDPDVKFHIQNTMESSFKDCLQKGRDLGGGVYESIFTRKFDFENV